MGQRSGSSSLIRTQQLQIPHAPSSVMSEASDESPQSPSISDASYRSTVSSGRKESDRASVPLTRHFSANGDGSSITSSDEAILNPTATINMLQSGCLPGDIISVKVAINLGKHFKNPQGIILTIYRECHIDLHPAIPLGSWQDGKKQQYEDYYPKSRTGLAGLSLSSAGSSRVFRQDISQKTTALYVDRHTLTADVKASVQVPEGVFPTISSVPGAMIDFKYYVEAIIDLRGKSAIQERILPRLSMVNPVPSFGPGESTFRPEQGYESVKPLYNAAISFFETSQIRRDKGVVTHVSEIIVGTKDSGRGRAKKADHGGDAAQPETGGSRQYRTATDVDAYGVLHGMRHSHTGAENRGPNYDSYLEDSQTIDFAPAHDMPPPEIEDQVDEKTRLKRAEEVLLPSSPRQDGASLRGSALRQPTAPAPFDEADLALDLDEAGPSAPAYMCSSTRFSRAAPALTTSVVGEGSQQDSLSHRGVEDKQELERQRLQPQTSSPDGDPTSNRVVDSVDMRATAPVLDEDTEATEHMARPPRHQRSTEHLPRYQA